MSADRPCCRVGAHERAPAIEGLLREHTAVDAVAIAYGLPEAAVEAHAAHIDRPEAAARNVRGFATIFDFTLNPNRRRAA